MIEALINIKNSMISKYAKILKFASRTTQNKNSFEASSDSENYQKKFHQELIKQNEKHIVSFIIAVCFAIIAYIGYDYLTLPLLWSQLLIWRLLAVLSGVIAIILFLRRSISVFTTIAIFFIVNALTTGYFVSLYNDPILLIAGHVNLSMALFILPLTLLTFPLGFNVMFTIVFFSNYLFWHFMIGSVAFSELMIYGGIFQIFAILMSFFGHWSKVRSTKKFVELNMIIENKNHEILEQNRKLELKATYDILTGAYNLSAGLQILEDRFSRHQRGGLELTIVYIDIDNVKTTNDGLGHRYGDQLILGVVESIRGAIRDSDMVCRLGGDEFLVVMDSCELPEVKNIMLRICTQLEFLSFGSPFPYEISWGAMNYNRDDFSSLEEFIDRADQIMYESKQAKKLTKKLQLES